MRISCVLNSDQLDKENPDLIVFPEGISWAEIHKAEKLYPRSIIGAAVNEGSRSRGVLWHEGRNQINYLKVETDGQTEGTKNLQQNPVCELKDACIGVITCMDIDLPEFSVPIIEKVKLSKSDLKLVCIPADMSSNWFHIVQQQYEGVHLIVCNHTQSTIHRDNRCKSFITDTHCHKIKVQEGEEPIHYQLP